MKTETAPELEQAEKKKHGFLRILAILLLLQSLDHFLVGLLLLVVVLVHGTLAPRNLPSAQTTGL